MCKLVKREVVILSLRCLFLYDMYKMAVSGLAQSIKTVMPFWIYKRFLGINIHFMHRDIHFKTIKRSSLKLALFYRFLDLT